MFPDDLSRIILLAGHYGSGKTTIAVNIALELKKKRERVTLCDLDIVNPYFRSAGSRSVLENAGVRLISSSIAGSSLESPGFPPEAASVFDDGDVSAVIDVGGDDRGALALGRYAGKLGENADKLFVINMYRPLSSAAKDAAVICREIETAGRFRFSGIINNSNLGTDTTEKDVSASAGYAGEVSEILGLPIVATCAADWLDMPGAKLRLINIFEKWVTL
jgi:energy-coupling factor transporter ATP-binding protein EcfA2